MTVLMVRIMAPFLTLVSLAALFMGALNALRVFFVPALAPGMFNVVMIVAIVVAGQWAQQWWARGLEPMVVVALGVCVAGLLQGLVQLPWLWVRGMGPTLKWVFSDRDVTRVFKKLGPGLVGLGVGQVNLVVSTVLATGTVVGAVSWLSFAFRLFQFPVGVMGVAVANSNLVLFSAAWKQGQRGEALGVLGRAISFSLFLLLPSSALLWALALLAVQVIFQRGEFGPEDSLNTANLLQLYALGLPGYGLYKLLTPVFYVLDRERVPVMCAMVAVGFNIVFCVALVPHYGVAILALGMSLSTLLNVVIQGVILRHHSIVSGRNCSIGGWPRWGWRHFYAQERSWGH